MTVFNSDLFLMTVVLYRTSMDFTKFVFAGEFVNFLLLQAMKVNEVKPAGRNRPENPYPDGILGVIEGASIEKAGASLNFNPIKYLSLDLLHSVLYICTVYNSSESYPN